MRYTARHSPQCGFTLIELMTAIALAGILLAIGIPSYNEMIRNNCLTTNANALVTSIQVARTEAIKRRETMDLTPASGLNWSKGWKVRQQGGATDLQEYSTAGCNIRVYNSNTSAKFTSRGNAETAQTFNFCDGGNNPRKKGESSGRVLSISLIGRHKLEKGIPTAQCLSANASEN